MCGRSSTVNGSFTHSSSPVPEFLTRLVFQPDVTFFMRSKEFPWIQFLLSVKPDLQKLTTKISPPTSSSPELWVSAAIGTDSAGFGGVGGVKPGGHPLECMQTCAPVCSSSRGIMASWLLLLLKRSLSSLSLQVHDHNLADFQYCHNLSLLK